MREKKFILFVWIKTSRIYFITKTSQEKTFFGGMKSFFAGHANQETCATWTSAVGCVIIRILRKKFMKSETREMICVVCPNGCRLSLTLECDDCASQSPPRVVSVKGAVCRRGEEYAAQECVAPKRMVTTLIRVVGRRTPLSVKTARPDRKSVV